MRLIELFIGCKHACIFRQAVEAIRSAQGATGKQTLMAVRCKAVSQTPFSLAEERTPFLPEVKV